MSYPWESKAIEAAVQEILDSMELPAVDPAAKRALQRIYYRRNRFHGDGAGHLTLLIRTVAESETNGIAALIEPVIIAVDGVMRPEWTETGLRWLEAFDTIHLMAIVETMRGLDIFSEGSLGRYLEMAIWNRLVKVFTPAQPVKVKRERKPPASIARIAGVEKNIAVGLELLKLRSTTKHNMTFGRALRRQFELDGQHAGELMRVARAYGDRADIYRRLAWTALLELSSPKLPAAVRAALEQRIVAGDRIDGPTIRRARRARPARADGARLAA